MNWTFRLNRSQQDVTRSTVKAIIRNFLCDAGFNPRTYPELNQLHDPTKINPAPRATRIMRDQNALLKKCALDGIDIARNEFNFIFAEGGGAQARFYVKYPGIIGSWDDLILAFEVTMVLIYYAMRIGRASEANEMINWCVFYFIDPVNDAQIKSLGGWDKFLRTTTFPSTLWMLESRSQRLNIHLMALTVVFLVSLLIFGFALYFLLQE